MKYWLITGLFMMVFRSYAWGLLAPIDMDNDYFWSVHRLFGSIAILCFVKSAGYGRPINDRLLIDFILAFMWADVFDRLIGITYLNWKDCFIPLFAIMNLLLAVKHHERIYPYYLAITRPFKRLIDLCQRKTQSSK